MSDELFNLDAVARKLKVSREQVRRLCAAGKLPYVSVGVGSRETRRVLSSTLDAFMRNERRAGVAQEMRNINETQRALSAVEERW